MKTHKIKFYHFNPAITELYPAMLGSEFSMEWVKNERKTWNASDEETKLASSSLLKCPGIFEMYSKGFFIQQPYDILLTLKDDDLRIQTPDLSYLFDGQSVLGRPDNQATFHRLVDSSLPFRKDTLPCVPNIPTGFHLLANIPLLLLPVPYPDQYEWETSTGILDTRKSPEVNLQLFLNNYKDAKEKTWKVNAGDNIYFVIPLTSDNWVIENELTSKDKLWLKVNRLVQSKSNKCPVTSAIRYSTLLPEMKKKLNILFKRLWES